MWRHRRQHMEDGLIPPQNGSAEPRPSTREPGPAEPQKGYVCSECGKVYTYLVSFKKHLLEHSRGERDSGQAPGLTQYPCPFCGMVFVRMSKLQFHMRSHNEAQEARRCEQCDRTFYSNKTYLSHVELHQQNPLWCLGCCRGFKDEASINLHLQRHQLGKHKCDLCSKRFLGEVLLKRHYKTSHPTYAPAPSPIPDEQEAPEGEAVDGAAPCADEEPEPVTDFVKSNSDLEDLLELEESDCGEPSHCKASDDPSDGRKQHRYYEWECVECDVGFEELSLLHKHYMQHATGEIPFPADVV